MRPRPRSGGGGGRRSRRPGPERGSDLRYDLEISFEEAAFGKETELNIPRTEECSTCHGTGAAPGTQPEECPQCHGTGQVQQAINESGIQEGMVLVNAMNITASVFINDDEGGLHHDYEVWLEKLAPEKPYSQYQHNGFEDNADAHLKRTIMGRETVVAVTNGRLDFGTWEQIFYYEFDGKRQKRVLVKIIGE